MSFALTPSKRPYEWNHMQPNGREKWNNFPLPSQHQRKMPSDSVVFRILCRASKTGSVIGKGGTIVTQIRKETGAKIRVEEPLPGCEERVVVIVGPEKDKEADKEQSREDGDENEGGDDGKEIKEEEDDEDKESEPLKDQQGDKGIPPAQKALLLVFERMVEGESENDTEDEANKKSSFIVRLLVPSIQVGCILGKGGSVIKQMSAESGAQIRILPRDKIPSCAMPSEELVQISGPVDSARKALQSVSQQLLENPPRERDTFLVGKSSFLATHSLGPVPHSEVLPPLSYHSSAQGPRHAFGLHDGSDFFPSASPSVSMFHDPARSSRINSPPDILSFRLLCTNEKVGGVIGKGGSIVRNIHGETGADIKILDAVQDTDDRIIAISAPVHPMDRIAAAQDALLRVQHRIVRAIPDPSDKNVLSRLLVPSNQIGCLLGKGGSIMAEMRKLSGAQIRILAKDQISKCASEHEEEVQMSGEFESVQEALVQVTSRLRHNMFRGPPMHHPLHNPFHEHIPPMMPYMGRREPSPQRMYPNFGPSPRKFDQAEVLAPHEERPVFPHSVQPGIPHGSERMPVPTWPSHGSGSAAGGLPDYPGAGPPSRATGFGSHPAIITNTTVEVVVPRAFVPSIYGEDGECLRQIRQISGAKITITDPRPADTETVIIISGTPDQTHAAQSLLQAFVMSGQGSP
ncbi:unnamed protein product [Victoria cruziana]